MCVFKGLYIYFCLVISYIFEEVLYFFVEIKIKVESVVLLIKYDF